MAYIRHKRINVRYKILAVILALACAAGGYLFYMKVQQDELARRGDIESDINQQVEKVSAPEVKFEVFNDKDGVACFIDCKDKEVLIDSGTKEGAKKLIKAIKKDVNNEIDYIISTGDTPERTGGFEKIMEEFETGLVYSTEYKFPTSLIASNTTIELGNNVSLTMLVPEKSPEKAAVLLQIGTKNFFIPGGGMTGADEKEIMSTLPSDFFVVVATDDETGNVMASPEDNDQHKSVYYLIPSTCKNSKIVAQGVEAKGSIVNTMDEPVIIITNDEMQSISFDHENDITQEQYNKDAEAAGEQVTVTDDEE